MHVIGEYTRKKERDREGRTKEYRRNRIKRENFESNTKKENEGG